MEVVLGLELGLGFTSFPSLAAIQRRLFVCEGESEGEAKDEGQGSGRG